MINLTALPQQFEEHLINELRAEDPKAQVKIKRTSLGWLNIRLITISFEDKSLDEREKKIDQLLEGINTNLGQYPIAGYDLLTPQEATEQSLEYIQLPLPLWSDILMAPEPDQPAVLDEDSPNKSTQVVTFYSFKGGVGRSTALGLVAGILANRNRRVVMVDFDLEAPGITILFRSDAENLDGEQYGVLDYLHQRYLTPEQNIPSIESCISQVKLPARGELFLVTAGEYDENYIHRLAGLNRQDERKFLSGRN